METWFNNKSKDQSIWEKLILRLKIKIFFEEMEWVGAKEDATPSGEAQYRAQSYHPEIMAWAEINRCLTIWVGQALLKIKILMSS